jgi:hypothetical protein
MTVVAISTCAFLGIQAPAMADTGAGGVPILYADVSPMVHTCNVIGGDGTWNAVLCSDLITTQGSVDYTVQGQSEAYCEEANAPYAMGTCQRIMVDNHLYVGSGSSTADAKNLCDGDCPVDGRLYVSSSAWGYTIAGGENGVCSSNVDSAYQVWGIITEGVTSWTLPDGDRWTLDGGGANDGINESSGHYFVCP